MRFILSVWVILAGLTQLAYSAEATPALAEVRAAFRTPPKAYRPMVRWWWPGGDVTDAELRREIGLLDAAGFGGAEIQPFSIGLYPNMPEAVRKRVNDYLTPSFFSHVRATLDEAHRRGMWLDFTFGSGWPLGGGRAITPELMSMELRFTQQTVRGPLKLRTQLQVPRAKLSIDQPMQGLLGGAKELPEGWRERLKQRETVVAVIAARGPAAALPPPQLSLEEMLRGSAQIRDTAPLEPHSIVVLTHRVSASGTLEWDVPEGEWQIFTFAQLPADLYIYGGVGEAPHFVLDHLKRKAFEAHASRVGDSLRAEVGGFFGQGLRAVFSDSLEVTAYLPWTDDFLAEFRRRRGYDLTPFLPILRMERSKERDIPLYDLEEIGERVRHDYRQTVSDLVIENYFQPFADWASRHKLLSRVQAHGVPESEVLSAYATADIPETEALGAALGGNDYLTAASAAHVYGRNVVSSESFAWLGNPYRLTPEAIKRHADELITAGINQIIYHGFPYEYMDRPEPGWYPFPYCCTGHVNQHNPFWSVLSSLNAYISRLQYLSQVGTHVAPVAVLGHVVTSVAYPPPPPPKPELYARLPESGYNFDHINADALLKGRVEKGQLISPGGARYSVLILQNQQRISLEVAQKVAGFAAENLPIVFIGSVPKEEIGYLDYMHRSKRIQALMSKIRKKRGSVYEVDSVRDAIATIRELIRPNVHFLSSEAVPFTEWRIGDIETFFLRNPDTQERHLDLEFAAAHSPEIWDPWTGEIEPSRQFKRGDTGLIRMHITLPPYGSKLIVFQPNAEHSPIDGPSDVPTRVKGPLPIGEQGWSFHGIGLGRSGKQASHDLELRKLVDWYQHPQLRDFAGRGTYTTRFNLDPSWFGQNRRIVLGLGDVKEVAEIRVNGRSGPTLLLRPHEAEITDWVKLGDNTLEITVTSTLVNAAPEADKSLPFMELAPILTKFGELLRSPAAMGGLQRIPSGLIGPVTLSRFETTPQ